MVSPLEHYLNRSGGKRLLLRDLAAALPAGVRVTEHLGRWTVLKPTGGGEVFTSPEAALARLAELYAVDDVAREWLARAR